MRKLRLFATGILAFLFCVQAEDPIEVVKSFEAALIKKDFAKAERYVSASYKPEYEILKAETKRKPVKAGPESIIFLKIKLHKRHWSLPHLNTCRMRDRMYTCRNKKENG